MNAHNKKDQTCAKKIIMSLENDTSPKKYVNDFLTQSVIVL